MTEAAEKHLDSPPERTRIRFLEVGENEVAVGGAFVQPPDTGEVSRTTAPG